MSSMSCLDEELGGFVLSTVSQAGSDLRDGGAFSVAQSEMEKLNSIHSQSGVNWEKVAGSCVKILREEGKDLTVAVWLLCAWVSLCGVSGLVSGVRMLRGLLEQHWFVFTPSLARLRARRNQVEWMLDWLDVKLGEEFEPVMAGQLARLLEDWDGIDVCWREQDAEGPCFLRLRRRLANLQVETVVAPHAAAALIEVAPVAAAIPATAQATPVVALSALNPVLPLGSLDDDETVEKAVNDRLAAFAPLIECCLQGSVMLPVLFRINRQVAWLTLEQAPMSQGNLTRLPPPPQVQMEVFARIQACGEPLDIVRFCEERLTAYPYWLDLNRVSHAALSRLGEEGATGAASLALETRHLLARLPTLSELTYADGQPFADGATRGWLESLMPAVRNAGEGDAIQMLIEVGRCDAAEGRLSAALLCLQEHLELVDSGRDRFRLRRAQCELLHRFDPGASLRVALDVLLQEAQAQGLNRWEPELIRPLLELALVSENDVSRSVWGAQLASMDLPAFWRLTGSRASGAQ
jgi:type VI secretion system protein VasJ